MSQEKYIGMDVHAATISAAVRTAEGKLLIDLFYAQPRSLSAIPAFHIFVIWAILSPSNCIT